MLALMPMTVFQATQKELAAEHQSNVRSTRLPILLTFALAEIAGRPNVSSENLIGARMLINTLLNLAEKPEVPNKTAPNKDIRTDAERAAEIKANQKKKEASK